MTAEARRRRLVALAAVIHLVVAPLASAHPLDEMLGLRIDVLSAEIVTLEPDVQAGAAPSLDGAVIEVGLALSNDLDAPITLHEVRPAIGRRARLIETLRVGGRQYRRETARLTLAAGEARAILPPDSRILIEGVRAEEIAGRWFRMTLDFGPDGAPEILLRLPPPRVAIAGGGDADASIFASGADWGRILDDAASLDAKAAETARDAPEIRDATDLQAAP